VARSLLLLALGKRYFVAYTIVWCQRPKLYMRSNQFIFAVGLAVKMVLSFS
jgi:hypothetical protein